MASAVDAILAAGKAALPAIAASPDELGRLIATRLEGEDNPSALAADELYLAAACALADRAALAAFEQRYFGVIPAALSRLSLSRDEISEVAQQLRIRLFVAEGGDTPRVVAYAGQGQLGGLVRVAAVRAGLNLLRDRGRLGAATGGAGDDGGDELEDIPISSDNPELARLKAQHRAAFKAAFEQAINSLEPRERSLLGLALVKGLGIDRIGAIYGVHRATAARWVTSARANLTRALHKILAVQLGVEKSGVEDLLPLVESQLELSLERLLRSRVTSSE
jgi:RNA polymerase sigma-70 factor, ECF subfamily